MQKWCCLNPTRPLGDLFCSTDSGKFEFNETIRYFQTQLQHLGVEVKLGKRANRRLAAFDEVVVATGVQPRVLNIPGADRPEVVSYVDVLKGHVKSGNAWRLLVPEASA